MGCVKMVGEIESVKIDREQANRVRVRVATSKETISSFITLAVKEKLDKIEKQEKTKK